MITYIIFIFILSAVTFLECVLKDKARSDNNLVIIAIINLKVFDEEHYLLT